METKNCKTCQKIMVVRTRQLYCSRRCFFASRPNFPASGGLAFRRWQSAKNRAARKQIDFDLTVEFVYSLISKPCVYCGELGPSTIDRVDNYKGYIQSNCASACLRCNVVKGFTLTAAEMMIVAEALGWKNLNRRGDLKK